MLEVTNLSEEGDDPRTHRPQTVDPADHISQQIAVLARWPAADVIYSLPPEPHQVVFWASTWGVNNITRL